MEKLVNKLIQKKSFQYYPEDEFLVKKVLSFVPSENASVLDVGCGGGHFSILFEKLGAKVIAFDYNSQMIEENYKKAKSNKLSIKFMTADGNYPEKYFNSAIFDIIFMSGFSLFATEISKPLMEKYLKLLTDNGKLIFIQNSNQRGNIRKTNIRNYSIKHLKHEFSRLNCNIDEIFYYDRHVTGRILKSYAFSDISTHFHKLVTQITGLPCNIVIIISKKEKNR